ADPVEVLHANNPSRMHVPHALLRSGASTVRRPLLQYPSLHLGKAVEFVLSKELVSYAVRRHKQDLLVRSTYKCTLGRICRSPLHADTFSSNTSVDGLAMYHGADEGVRQRRKTETTFEKASYIASPKPPRSVGPLAGNVPTPRLRVRSDKYWVHCHAYSAARDKS